MAAKRDIWSVGLTIYIAAVFLQSLFFKFSGSPETVHIFSTLDRWAADSFGLAGLFAPGGLFSAAVVGSAELVASILLLAGLWWRRPLAHAAGAAIGFAVISGALFFHLATPLGVVIEDQALGVASDHGLLFALACGVWLAAAVLLYRNRGVVGGALARRR